MHGEIIHKTPMSTSNDQLHEQNETICTSSIVVHESYTISIATFFIVPEHNCRLGLSGLCSGWCVQWLVTIVLPLHQCSGTSFTHRSLPFSVPHKMTEQSSNCRDCGFVRH